MLFLWQMPHFLSLGWMYRKDYELGGYRLLPSLDRTGAVTARIIMVYTCALLPASVLPFILGMAGILFLGLVIVLWLSFFIPVLRLSREITDATCTPGVPRITRVRSRFLRLHRNRSRSRPLMPLR